MGQELQRIDPDNLGSGLITVDATGHVTRINPAARQILGLPDSSAGPRLAEPSDRPVGRCPTWCSRHWPTASAASGSRSTIARGGQLVPLGVNADFLTGADGVLMGRSWSSQI